ncbi:MAG: hypothetical protein ABII23_06410 [bacterium]
MFIEHLFLFSPVLLFASGISLFAWLVFKIPSRSRKSKTPRYKNSSLNAVLRSVQNPPEKISMEKFKAFSAGTAKKVYVSQGSKPLASEVYPDKINISEITGEIKRIFTEYASKQEKPLSVINSIEQKYLQITENASPPDTEQIKELMHEKNQCQEVISNLYASLEEQLGNKEKQLAEYITRYNHMQAQVRSVNGSPHAFEADLQNNLSALISSIRHVRGEAHVQRSRLINQITEMNHTLQSYESKRKEAITKLQEESLQTRARIQSEVSSLQEELNTIQHDMPALIEEKEEQINQMRIALELLNSRMVQEEDSAKQSIEQFKKHMEYKTTHAARVLDKARNTWSSEFGLLTEELNNLQQKIEGKEHALHVEMLQKQQVFAAEKSELETILKKMNQRFTAEQESFTQRRSSYEDALAKLRVQITDKETEFKAQTILLDQQKQMEKNRLLAVLNGLHETVEFEQAQFAQKQVAHAAQIERLRQESEDRMQHLVESGKSKTNMMIRENMSLRDHIASENKRLEFNIQTWKEHEIKLIEDKKNIEAQLLQLEKDMSLQQEKQHGAYVLETTEFNQQIRELEAQLEKTNNDYRELLDTQNWEIECLQVKEKRKAEQAKEEWLDKETKFSAERQELEREKQSLLEQMRKSSDSADGKRQELTDAIKTLRKEIPQKQEFADSLMHKRDREYKKLIQPLQEKISKIRSNLIGNKKMYEEKLSEKNDQVKTLKLRLAWRDERQQASEARRQKEIDKIRIELNKEIDGLRSKSNKLSIKQDKTLDPIVYDFEKLTQDLSRTEQRLEAEKTANEELRKGRLEIESEIISIEQNLPRDMVQYITLLDLKAKEITALNREILQKEHLMDTEEVISRDAMQRLRASFKTLKLQASKVISSKEKQPAEKQ